MSFLMSDKLFYNFGEETADKFGEVGFIVGIIVIVFTGMLGPMFNILGRKKPLVMSQILVAIGFYLIVTKLGSSLDHNLF